MNLRLRTDFLDYYDNYFDRTGPVFKRFSKNEISRTKMFEILKKNVGMRVPFNGICADVRNQFADEDTVVVYTDEFAHCGEGKELMYYGEAIKKHPDKLVAEYLKSEKKSISTRYLVIGNKSFVLGYCSDDEWRSNCGDVRINIVGEFDYAVPKINVPLYAIDFVKDCGIFYAVDFNTSPGIKGTGIEEILEPAEIVDLIKQSIEDIENRGYKW